MQLAPRLLQTLGAVLAMGAFLTALLLALQAPTVGLSLAADEGAGLRITASAVSRLGPADRVLSLGGVALQPDFVIEEPDMLPDWARYNDLMAGMRALNAAMEAPQVAAQLADGRRVDLEVRTRHWYQLPMLFWFQCFVGVVCFLLAWGVWVYRSGDRAAWHFALSGLGVMLSACCAAVYSSRELALQAEVFLWLSRLNHLGAMLFTSALVMLLWHYPTTLARRSPALLAYAMTVLTFVLFVWQVVPAPPMGNAAVLALFSFSFAAAFVQWRRTRGRPLERAALKWYLLSIYLGTGLFATGILLPVALGIAPPASQGLMFSVFLFMFAGIVAGITRYRLFDLDRWWFRAWSWFIGGLCLLLLDLALVSLFDMSQAGALGLSLALLGWVYFPARQWLWARLAGGTSAEEAGRSLGRALEALAAAPDEAQLRVRWRQVLSEQFAPLEVQERPPAAASGVAIAENGLALHLPEPGGGPGLALRLPQSGARLFGRDDAARGEVLWRMVQHVHDAMQRRETDVQAERGRIMRDLHDDLGGKLLSMVYMGQGEMQQIARAAMQDMRDVLSALGSQGCSLDEALATWRTEAAQRMQLLGRQLDWCQPDDCRGVWLSARQQTNLGRIVREAITNSLKHADAPRVRVEWVCEGGAIGLRVEDERGDQPSAESATQPRTARTIGERVSDLGGTVQWQRADAGGTVVQVSVPVAPA
ncbi:MAG: hypothetical protein J0H69_09210 [Burkholderiales bacterium]|nr:hypothetical protein [Burkholderiales bacterium]